MTTNRTRAKRAEKAINSFAPLGGADDPAEAITDLVADIGHFCVEHDLAYLHLLSQGISHWRLEMTDPDSMTMPEVTIIINESNDHA